jgi:hypothetical protein
MLGKFRLANRLELSVGIGFTLIGFFVGSLLIRSTLNNKINLESSQEVSEPVPNPYVSEVSPSRENPHTTDPQEKDINHTQSKNLPAAPSASNDEFSRLSQEEKNCVIWKNAYPEAAYKLKKGDACY